MSKQQRREKERDSFRKTVISAISYYAGGYFQSYRVQLMIKTLRSVSLLNVLFVHFFKTHIRYSRLSHPYIPITCIYIYTHTICTDYRIKLFINALHIFFRLLHVCRTRTKVEGQRRNYDGYFTRRTYYTTTYTY